jgi:hypothetical protein
MLISLQRDSKYFNVWMPVPQIGGCEIFIFLDLANNLSFLDGHYLLSERMRTGAMDCSISIALQNALTYQL